MAGRTAHAEETLSGASKRGEPEKTKACGNTNTMEATKERSSVWQQDMEQGIIPLSLWCSQVTGAAGEWCG